MPMFIFQFEVRPKETHPLRAEIAGAMVNCWIQRETQSLAEAVARGRIGNDDWRITRTETAKEVTRDTQHPEGLDYFRQAEIDGEVFVYHTWPVRRAHPTMHLR